MRSIFVHYWFIILSTHPMCSLGSQGPKASCGQRRLWSDWADAEADLSLYWVHRSFCLFCCAVVEEKQVIYIWATTWNQRTCGPVNAYLTPGPGIHFNAFIHVYSPRTGTDNDKILMSTEIPYHTAHMLQVLKWSLRNLILYTFLMILYMYIAPRQYMMSTESPYHFHYSLQVSNKSLSILILYTFFNVFPHVYSPKAGADNPFWTKSWCRQTLPICCKFQKISLKSAFIHNFSCFYINMNLLSLCSFAVSFFH